MKRTALNLIAFMELVENRVLSHPDKPYETNDFVYWLSYCGECAILKRKAKDNSSGHIKDKVEIVAYYNKEDLE